MIHEQEKMELLNQKQEIATALLDNKLLSREWVYENIFDFNDDDKKKIFDGIIEDTKQKFRFEQIETEGNDPTESGEKAGDDSGDDGLQESDWGGDRRTGDGESETVDTGFDSDDLKDATKYEKEKYGKREFKGKSPLATSKGSTLVRREGLLANLKNKFGKNVKNKSILSEDTILDE